MIPYKYGIWLVAFVLLSVLFCHRAFSQGDGSLQKAEVASAVQEFNDASKSADLEKVMSLFDEADTIMLVGSANGEICKGREQVRKWLAELYGFAGFSWEMERVDIEVQTNTAWVFMDGTMVVVFHKGGVKRTPYRFTGVLVHTGRQWKWRLFNGSVPQQE